MHGHWLSTTRKLNRHYQSGAGATFLWQGQKSLTEYYTSIALNATRRAVGGFDPVSGFPVNVHTRRKWHIVIDISAPYAFEVYGSSSTPDSLDLVLDVNSGMSGTVDYATTVPGGYTTSKHIDFVLDTPAECTAQGHGTATLLEILTLYGQFKIDHSQTSSMSQVYDFTVKITEV